VRVRVSRYLWLLPFLALGTGVLLAGGIALSITAGWAGVRFHPPTAPAEPWSAVDDEPVSHPAQAVGSLTPLAALGEQQSSTPVPVQAASRAQYQVQADLDYSAHTVLVQQQITYPNRSTDPLAEVVLVVEPNRRPGIFTLREVRVDGRMLPSECCMQGLALRIPVEPPLQPGRQTVITLAYVLRLPQISKQAFGGQGTLGWTPRQINLGDWLPLVATRTETGWHVPRYSAIGEYAVYDLADFDVTISVRNTPEHVHPQVIAPGTRTQEGERLHFQLDRSRSFAWSVSASMGMAETAVGDIRVESFYFPEHEAAGKAALRVVAAALAQFSRLFGPYPYTSLRIVEGDFLDGMEYCGLFFLGRDYYAAYDGTPRNYLTTIAAHETAHQWWYCRVGNDPAREPWLDEALATFSELLYFEEHHPDAVEWWWDFRVHRFQPRGWVDSSVYEFSSARAYINSVYLRGVLFFRDLRAHMGEAALVTALRDYASAYDGQIATASALWQVLDRHSAISLQPVHARYFRAKALTG
jgi:hypothetical protein